MPTPRSVDVLVRAARLYYEQGLSQGEVARELQLSGSTVSRVLAAAREQGLVEIRIHDPRLVVTRSDQVEQQLVEAFGLTEARVGLIGEGISPETLVGKLAAGYFTEHANEMARVGLSWGQTIGQFVAEVPTFEPPARFTVLPLVGGLPTSDTASAGGTLIQSLAQRCGVRASRLMAPAVVESAATAAALRKESSIATALTEAATVDHAFVGIGSVGVGSSPAIVEAMRLSESERAQFEAAGPVGDMCGRFFDADGSAIGPPAADRVIGITLEELVRVPTVVGLAAGVAKAAGALAALRTGAVNVPIFDIRLACAVLDLHDRGRSDAGAPTL